MTPGSRTAGFKSDRIVHRILKALLAAQVALSGFDGNVSEKKLDLFEFTSGLMAKASTRSAQIVWSKPCQSATRCSLSNDRPDHLRRKAIPPRPARLVDGSEQGAAGAGVASRQTRKSVRNGHAEKPPESFPIQAA